MARCTLIPPPPEELQYARSFGFGATAGTGCRVRKCVINAYFSVTSKYANIWKYILVILFFRISNFTKIVFFVFRKICINCASSGRTTSRTTAWYSFYLSRFLLDYPTPLRSSDSSWSPENSYNFRAFRKISVFFLILMKISIFSKNREIRFQFVRLGGLGDGKTIQHGDHRAACGGQRHQWALKHDIFPLWWEIWEISHQNPNHFYHFWTFQKLTISFFRCHNIFFQKHEILDFKNFHFSVPRPNSTDWSGAAASSPAARWPRLDAMSALAARKIVATAFRGLARLSRELARLLSAEAEGYSNATVVCRGLAWLVVVLRGLTVLSLKTKSHQVHMLPRDLSVGKDIRIYQIAFRGS